MDKKRKEEYELAKMIRLTENMGLKKTSKLFEDYAYEGGAPEEHVEDDGQCPDIHEGMPHDEWEAQEEMKRNMDMAADVQANPSAYPMQEITKEDLREAVKRAIAKRKKILLRDS